MDRKILLIIFFVCLILPLDYTKADTCDDDDIERLRILAENVSIDHEYLGDESVSNLYQISISGLTDELYVYTKEKDYTYEEAQEGVVKFNQIPGTYQFQVYSSTCPDILLSTKNVKLPKFNNYSLSKECKELKDYDLEVCDEWYQDQITDEIFMNTINYYRALEKEKNNPKEKITKFLKENYLFIIGGVVLVVVIVIGSIIHRKRSVLE